MVRNDLYRLLENYPSFVLKEKLTEKQLQNAFEHIMPGVRVDDVVALYDATILKNGKNGIAVTTHAMYCNGGSVEIPYEGLTKIDSSPKSSSTAAFVFHYVDGTSKQYDVSYPDAGELAKLLLEISRDLFFEKDLEKTKSEQKICGSDVNDTQETLK